MSTTNAQLFAQGDYVHIAVRLRRAGYELSITPSATTEGSWHATIHHRFWVRKDPAITPFTFSDDYTRIEILLSAEAIRFFLDKAGAWSEC